MKKALSFIAIAFACLLSSNITAQIITTIAGDGDAGYSGDGAAATAAELNHPINITFDHSGNLFIADQNNHAIRKVTPSGIISVVAGNGSLGFTGDNGPAIAAQLNYPAGISFNTSGDLFIADQYNNVIRKVNSSGIISTVAGGGIGGDGGPATDARLVLPAGITMDRFDNLYIAEYGNNRVRKVDASGTITTVAGIFIHLGYSGDDGPATAAELCEPNDVAINVAGNLLIVDKNNNSIRQVSASGTITTIAGHFSSCIEFGSYGGDGAAATAAHLNGPMGVVADVSGNIYIADQANAVIRKINTSGIISTIAGNNIHGYSGDNGIATSAQLRSPIGLAMDSLGNLYVADQYNNRVRKINLNSLNCNELTSSGEKISLNPNPNSGTFTLKASPNTTSNNYLPVEVTNIFGQTVYKNYLVMQNGVIEMEIKLDEHLPNGMYFLRIESALENSSLKFILQK